jgi:hypothetical protein
MLSRIFPRSFDNRYRGHWLAIPILAIAAGMKGAQGVASMVDTTNILTGPDAIPLLSYSAGAQETMVLLAILLGFQVAFVPLICVISLIRYRTMMPLMYLLLLLAQLGNRVLVALFPIPRIAHPEFGFAGQSFGTWVNIGIFAVTLAGFSLSLLDTKLEAKEKLA